MRKIITVIAVIAVTIGLGTSAALALTPVSTVGDAPSGVVGSFDSKHVEGVSRFVQTSDGGTVYVIGNYSKLDKNRAFFTVAYGNGNCDPAQAFPVGPFVSNSKGKALFSAGVPSSVSIAGSGSVSVRIGDTDKAGNPTDQDGDGKTGASDVVAVPGKPKVGLVKCDTSPLTVTP